MTAWRSTSASLWPTSCRSCGTSMPPRRSGPPGAVRCESSPRPIRRVLVVRSPVVGGLVKLRGLYPAVKYATTRADWKVRGTRGGGAKPQAMRDVRCYVEDSVA